MSQKLNIAALLLTALVVGCKKTTSESAPAITAEALREGCVGDHLATLLAAADRLAPYAFARSRAALEQTAAQVGAELELDAFDGEPFRLSNDSVRVRGETRPVHATLEYLVEGEVTPDLERADTLRANVEVEGAIGHTFLTLELAPDGNGGISVRGRLESTGFDDCVVSSELDGVSMRIVADAPVGRNGALFVSGETRFLIEKRDGAPVADGEAAFIGRRALVLLHLDGEIDLTEVDLVPGG